MAFTWPSLVPAADHGAHAEAHSFVLVDHVSQQFGGSSHRDALLVAQLVDATLPGQQTLPKTAVCSSSGHGAQQIRVYLDNLLHRLRRDVGTGGGSGVYSHDDAMLELRKSLK